MVGVLATIIGLVLIFLEFYLPGGIMGAAGAILMITGIVFFSIASGSVIEITIFITVSIIALIGTIKLALWSVKRTRKTKSLFLEDDQEGFRAERYEDDLVLKEGECHTQLRPGGFVLIDKKKYAAISLSGFLPKGEKITVVSVEGETLKVKKRKEG